MIYHLKNTLSAITPKTSIAIDTNILLWTFYDNISYTNIQNYQKNIYPNFLSTALLDKRNKLYTTTSNIFEMFNIIENIEYRIYLEQNNLLENDFKKKDFRKIKEEREKFKRKLTLLYKQISTAIQILDSYNNKTFLEDYIFNFEKHKYDIYDFSLINTCINNNIKNILTDDSDFSSYSYLINNLNIITANNNLN